ncbi:hypothetical protein [Paraburkholderia silvatlantica]|uniref:hypothetical protein n=1 Tax=Paraburkholderia silvatlantica TaxID=321895 RepID=UPI00374FECF4
MSDDTIRKLPVRKRPELGSDRMLAPVTGTRCFHTHGFLVDDRASEVTCAACREKLNPMWVLLQLMHKESRWHELHARYQDELKRLNERERTKCQHCGQMTRISHR